MTMTRRDLIANLGGAASLVPLFGFGRSARAAAAPRRFITI